MSEVQYIDYGVGNQKSIVNALKYLKKDFIIIDDVKNIDPSQPIILPGVGSFSHCKNELDRLGFFKPLKKMLHNNEITNLVGICVGMQMLFERGYENGECEGFGVFKGEINLLSINIEKKQKIKLPNISWIDTFKTESDLLSGKFYFIHSYGNIESKDQISYYKFHESKVTAVAKNKGIWGTQFHPEKSGISGLKMLDNMITS